MNKRGVLFERKSDDIGSVLISLAITLFVFENLSWYHFGDIPSTVVSVNSQKCAEYIQDKCRPLGRLRSTE